MKYLNKYSFFVNESSDIDNDVIEDIIDIMQEIIDDGYNPLFKSNYSDMRYSDYLEKNTKYSEFKPVFKGGRRIKSKFGITFHSLQYEKLVKVMDEMVAVKGRLGDKGWYLSDLKIGNVFGTTKNVGDDTTFEVVSSFIAYSFSKPDQILDDSEKPNEEQIKKAFDGILYVEESNITIYDNYVTVAFDSLSYDGKLPSFDSLENIFNKICDNLGFSEYEYNEGNWGVKFWF